MNRTEIQKAKRSIQALTGACHRTAVEKGFWKSGKRNVGEALMLISSELAEALEVARGGDFEYLVAALKAAYRKDPKRARAAVLNLCRSAGAVPPKEKRYARDHFAEEMADVLIRVFDLCGGMKVDLGAALAGKMRFNRSRPRLHGRKF